MATEEVAWEGPVPEQWDVSGFEKELDGSVRIPLPTGSAREFAKALNLWLGIASAGQLALLIGEMEWQRANQPTQ